MLFGGAKGPGKTDCLIADAARGIGDPNYKALLLRRTFPRLQEILDRCKMMYAQAGGDWRKVESRFTFPSGAKITLGHCQHEDDKRTYHGREFNYIGFDELTEFTETQYSFIIANVRRSRADAALFIRATTNPGGLGHTWVKRYYYDACKPKRQVEYLDTNGVRRMMYVPEVHIDPTSLTSRCFVPATVYDNANIMAFDPGYVRRLELLPEIEKMRLLHGVWDAFEGQVFAELSATVHGCHPFPIPPDWTRIMAFDWGYARPWCALYMAVDFENTVYLYRMVYGAKEGHVNVGRRQTNDQICEEILAVERASGHREKISLRVADPACWSPTMRDNKIIGPSFTEDATRHGLFFLKADNDRLRGKQQLHQRLQLETETDPATGEVIKEYPRMVVFNDMRDWWRVMLELREDAKNPEDVDTDQEDHPYDVTRYLCMTRPVAPKVRSDIPQGTFASERRRLVRAKEFARRHGVSLAVAYGRVR